MGGAATTDRTPAPAGLPARAVVVTALAVAAVLSPLSRSPSEDSFPLSTYPMFASPRGGEQELTVARGVGPDGRVVRLSPEAIAGTDEVIQASGAVRRAVADGRAAELCSRIAAGLDPDEVSAVEVATDRIAAVAVAAGAPPESTIVHARCEVP